MPSATAHSRRRRSIADPATSSLCPSEPRASIFFLNSRALTALTIFLPATPIAGSACHPPRCPSISAGQFLLCRSGLHHHLFDRFLCPSFGFTAVHAEDSLLLSSVDAIFTSRREPTEGSRFSTLQATFHRSHLAVNSVDDWFEVVGFQPPQHRMVGYFLDHHVD
ncbi:hypothetical protein ZIOFF_044500 [Zingiber officinale]|uniref:Uncharacterized protein n=1 Tax=Zingiber officinale TaxID=94328 RepID=A0A8J5L016_ZINOF|nr:hypothetical protein ZIOFF_044500 [Zingiber officinale]